LAKRSIQFKPLPVIFYFHSNEFKDKLKQPTAIKNLNMHFKPLQIQNLLLSPCLPCLLCGLQLFTVYSS